MKFLVTIILPRYLYRFKVEIDDKTKVLQQWEGSLQQMQHEFAIQRQQNEDAMQRRWEQLQRESAIQQQSGYNVPAYGQPPYWGGSGYAVMHSPGPDMYQPSSQLAGEPNVMPKYPKPLDSNCETLPSSKCIDVLYWVLIVYGIHLHTYVDKDMEHLHMHRGLNAIFLPTCTCIGRNEMYTK